MCCQIKKRGTAYEPDCIFTIADSNVHVGNPGHGKPGPDLRGHDVRKRRRQVGHNHPADETEYSFSKDDYILFVSGELAILRGVDEKYTYELRRDCGIAPEFERVPLFLMSPEDTMHYLISDRARKEGFFYERKPRKSKRS